MHTVDEGLENALLGFSTGMLCNTLRTEAVGRGVQSSRRVQWGQVQHQVTQVCPAELETHRTSPVSIGNECLQRRDYRSAVRDVLLVDILGLIRQGS